jgi:alpha-glucosidase
MDLIRKANIAVRRVGLVNTLRFIRYARWRDRLERQAGCLDVQTSSPIAPGSLQAVDPIPSGWIFRFENSSLEVLFLASDLVRLSWSPGVESVPYGIAQTEWPPVQIELLRDGDGWQIQSDQLRIHVDSEGIVHYTGLDENSLRTDLAPERRAPLVPESGSIHHEPRWTLRTLLKPETAIYGLGLRAFPLNLRGRSYRMWNTDPPGGYGPGVDPLYMCIPVYLAIHHSGSYLVFFENSFSATFSFPHGDQTEKRSDSSVTAEEDATASFEGGMLRYYFIPGPPERALERYSQLTGRATLPPRWALGYHQSRWGYQSEADIREVAQGFKGHELPLSAIHLDLDYMHGFRVFTVDPERFPDLSGLAEDLSRQDIRLVTILDPGVKLDPGYALYDEGLRINAFCNLPDQEILRALVWPGWSVFPDFTNPQVRAWWGAQYSGLLSQGIAGIWHDMNEPASFTAWGDFTLPVPTLHDLEGRGGTHLEAHNLYGLLMDKAGYEALEKFLPDKRPWLLSRSGWVGVARYAWSWTADIETSWEALRQTISSVLGLSLSGVPYSGSDIGGFSGVPDPELYLRWFQMSAFMPFFRMHSTKEVPPREPWRFGEPVLGIVREFLRLRYRLMPYLYTLAWECAQKGWPLVRPLFWPDENDPHLWEVDDAFTLGSSLLVAPVLEPGADSRHVALPAGVWFDFWDDSFYAGSSHAELPTSLERIPVLVRAGSLLTLEEKGVLHLHFYPMDRGESQGFLYSDAGDGYGAWRLDHFKTKGVEGEIEITRREEGEFPFPYKRIILIIHGMQVDRAWIDGEETLVRENALETGVFKRILFFRK